MDDHQETTQQLEVIKQETTPEKAEVAIRTSVSAGEHGMAIIPRDVDEAWRLSKSFVLAGMIPDSYCGSNNEETQAKVMLGILKGLEIGIAPVTALSTIMIVNQRPSLWGDGAIALVQRSGKIEIFRETHEGEELTDSWKAICEVKRVGQEITSREFTWAQAKAAGLINKGPWKQYPKRMLQMRARAWALRDIFADCLYGLSIAEEARDIEAMEPKVVDTSSLEDDNAN